MTKNLEKLEDSLLDALDEVDDLPFTFAKFKVVVHLGQAQKALED